MYRKNWSMGLLVPIKFKGKSKKMTQEFKARASGILGKIGKVYDTFAFILPERRKLFDLGKKPSVTMNEEFATTSAMSYYSKAKVNDIF